MTFLSQLYPSSQNEGTLRGEMNRQQAKNAFPGQELATASIYSTVSWLNYGRINRRQKQPTSYIVRNEKIATVKSHIS